MQTTKRWAAWLVSLVAATATPAIHQAGADERDPLSKSEPMPLWPDGPPGVAKDLPGPVPTYTVYLAPPEKATGASVVICPGGGYGGHADHEGRPIAEWLNGLGVSGIVLKYRLAPGSHHPAMLQDAARAIRTVRANAEQWKLDPNRIGVLGFSAGGHLASTIATHFDAGDPNSSDPVERFSSRPDRAILIYPVISLTTPFTHQGSKDNLLGPNASPELAESLSSELQVTPETPPTFLAHTTEDTAVPPENSLLFAMAMRKAGVPVELHLFEKGPHGLGLGREGFAFSEWPGLCEKWLEGQGFLKK
ncbi:alpha/beta hydrolase [Tundrisphaera lichenicola]|uniref:alpha/beta hydrolase n=1 Tax=Tundrisphaera lichenicola TaxID=2029860 RepID=UPI003EB69574